MIFFTGWAEAGRNPSASPERDRVIEKMESVLLGLSSDLPWSPWPSSNSKTPSRARQDALDAPVPRRHYADAAAIIPNAAVYILLDNLPVMGAMYLNAVRQQDIYLGGTFLILITLMAVAGNLVADILLALMDPRIRYQ